MIWCDSKLALTVTRVIPVQIADIIDTAEDVLNFLSTKLLLIISAFMNLNSQKTRFGKEKSHVFIF